MHLSTDQLIFWQDGFLKLNATIVYTWGLMLVSGGRRGLITRRLLTGIAVSRWQAALEIIVTAIAATDPRGRLAAPGTISRIHRHVSSSSSPWPTFSPSFRATMPPTGSLSTTDGAGALRVCGRADLRHPGTRLARLPWTYLEPTVIMLPFNIMGEFSRTLAMAVRLFGNMMSGTMILGILLIVAPFIFPTVMSALGLLIGMVQAYIFSILAPVYIASATGTEGGEPSNPTT